MARVQRGFASLVVSAGADGLAVALEIYGSPPIVRVSPPEVAALFDDPGMQSRLAWLHADRIWYDRALHIQLPGGANAARVAQAMALVDELAEAILPA